MNYLEMGGAYMMPMIPIGLIGLAALAYAAWGSFQSQTPALAHVAARLTRHIAVFLVVYGILLQAIGLFDALVAIESMGGRVSPALLAGGLKVSLVAPIFGLMEFVVLFAGYAVVRTRL